MAVAKMQQNLRAAYIEEPTTVPPNAANIAAVRVKLFSRGVEATSRTEFSMEACL
jgi:hypothetical protein